jgi:hypothetical protein
VGALVGPAQVAGRLLEFGLLRHVHPLLSARLAALAHPLGVVALLSFGAPVAAVFAVLHGAGNGILTIAKGTLPLVLFGPQGYGARQGWLMLPVDALWLTGALGLSAFVALLFVRAQHARVEVTVPTATPTGALGPPITKREIDPCP